MTDPNTAMLFCPPQPPIALKPDSSVSMGRQSTCDLAILRTAVSRRHAEIRYENGSYVICDLGSRNGTFVNGQRLSQPRALASGDRIEIGPATVTFCVVEVDGAVAAEPDTDAATIFMERPTGEAFQGNLSEIPAFAVFQVLEMGSKTGVLEITGEDDLARIWFESGRPVHAVTKKNLGADAALSVINTNEGEFRFDSGPVDTDRTIDASITELLLEACRLEDEGGR